MIFERAVRREFTHSAAGVFTALFAIMMTTQLIRLLNEAVQGSIEPDAVAALLGFAALNYLPHLLALALFIAILLTLSRGYRDSEMVVWFSSGVSLTAWIRPVMTFAAPLVATIAVLAFFLSRRGRLSESAEFRGKLSMRKDAGQVSPGAFQESSTGDRVVFVEGVADDSSQVRNVFVSETRPDRLAVTVAGSGYQEIAENGDRFIVLQDGRRYEFAPGTAEFRVLDYARYAVRLETRETRGIERTPRNMPTLELMAIDSRAHRAELLSRLSLPISAARAGLAVDSTCPSSIRVLDAPRTCCWRLWPI
jgi:lipopolysaccharide export system permease protein